MRVDGGVISIEWLRIGLLVGSAGLQVGYVGLSSRLHQKAVHAGRWSGDEVASGGNGVGRCCEMIDWDGWFFDDVPWVCVKQ